MEVMETSAKYLRISYVQTELGMLPADWRIAEIGEIAETSSGTTPSRSQYDRYFKGGVHAWVKTLDLNNAEILETDESVTDRAVEETSLRLFPKGSVLVAMYGGLRKIGRTGLLRLPAALNQAITSIRPNQAVFRPEFLVFYLNYRVGYWQSVASSSRKDPNITGADVRAFKLPLPEIGEQQRIATALADASALIESLEQLLTKKRQIKQGAMQELLTGKRRLPGFAACWKDRRIKALADVQRGASPRSIDDPVWFDDSSSVGWVRISDVTHSGMYLSATTQRLSEAGIRKSRFVPSGNLIMSICATVGRPIITELNTCIHDGFVVFDALKVDKKFLYYALLNIEEDWSKHGQTGSQMNLNTGLINRTEIPVPDELEEQSAIAQVLADMDADINVLESRLTKTRALKHAMAQALLTGRIRLVEPTA